MEQILLRRVELRKERLSSFVDTTTQLYEQAKLDIEKVVFSLRQLKDLVKKFDEEIKHYTTTSREPQPDVINSALETQFSVQTTLSSSHEHDKATRLPKLELPKYNGDRLKWSEFWDRFRANIHKRDLAKADKLSYLLSCLEGTALDAVSRLTTTDANYTIAIKTLQDRFGSDDILIDAHYTALNGLSCADYTSGSCRSTLDTIERHLKVLEKLGEPADGNHFRAIILSKFPDKIVQEHHLKDSGNSMAAIRKNLHRIITAMEKSTSAPSTIEVISPIPGSSGSTTEALQVRVEPKRQQPNRKRNADNYTRMPPTKKPRRSCIFCKRSNHSSSECKTVRTVEARKGKLSGRCLRCLNQNHRTEDCKKQVTCYQCKGDHMKLLCPNIDKDCLHLQLYRDPKDRFKKGQTKASLSLQQFLGFESGFTLDKESHTIAIICQDVTVVLAFETRERLIAWQVKVGGQLGGSKQFLVLVGGAGCGGRRLPPGPARLHLQGRRFALTSGVPPRLLGLWELPHLRRYGVVEGRFCFEGGSHCGKGEGLHVLITDQAQDITDSFDLAARGNLSLQRPGTSRKSAGNNNSRPNTRLSDVNTVDIGDTASALYEENFFGDDGEGISPFWPSDERRGFDESDPRPECCEGTNLSWGGADHVTLERCTNCLTKLGAMSRSSTVALNPGNNFNPAWTMEAVPESSSDNSSNDTEYLTPRAIRKHLESSCYCKDRPPQRPPKPSHMEQRKAPAPLPAHVCTCAMNDNTCVLNNPKVGPYENYDVPKASHTEVDNGKYYDTPKRIKQSLADDLFQVTKMSTPGALVLKKNCGCILKFGSKKKPVIVECEENLQPVDCPCQKVTSWANNLISLPYCKKNIESDKVNTEILSRDKAEQMALYATVDVTRKTNRQSGTISEKDALLSVPPEDTAFTNYENIEPKSEKKFEGPFTNYENLDFALSLEYYENAKDLLKKAGVTQTELDALSANLEKANITQPKKKICSKCEHCQSGNKNKGDEYLLMEPPGESPQKCQTIAPNPGYTPMSPNPNWSHSLRHPLHKVHHAEIEKSISNPVLNGSENRVNAFGSNTLSNINRDTLQKRSSSVDSARLLEDLKEFDSSIGSHATSSSLETLRNMAIDNRRSSSSCHHEESCYHECCKSSGSENKTSETDSSKEIPHLRNKLIDNAEIKRSSSVPCKSGGNRDSSSSNDSGVSSCSMKQGAGEFSEFEMPLTSGQSRHQYIIHKRMRGNLSGCLHSSLPRKSKSSDPLRDLTMQIHKGNIPAKSSSAEAEVPVLPPKQLKGVVDTHSTSSGTSDMSDYIETLSMSSSHSSSDAPMSMRISRQPTSTLRPRSGKEYHNLDPLLTSMYKHGQDLANYTNLP